MESRSRSLSSASGTARHGRRAEAEIDKTVFRIAGMWERLAYNSDAATSGRWERHKGDVSQIVEKGTAAELGWGVVGPTMEMPV